MNRHARIVGEVEYRQGDGPRATIPEGPIEIEHSAQDVTIAWTEGESRGSAAMPLTEFNRYVAEGAIVVEGKIG
jgi:hypothetical protein